MTSSPRPDAKDDAFWRDYLTNGAPLERQFRRFLKRVPREPRCTVCAAPFAGIGAPVMRVIGKRPSPQTPKMCSSCYRFLTKHHGGAEIEVSLLFADVRGSTALAERIPSAEFRGLMDRFYAASSKAVFEYDGSVDKFVGDELVAMFFPLLTGERHAARAIDAALAILRATGHEDAGGPWLPIGAGVHTGPAWVGAVGTGIATALTALGDTVNVAARLAEAASAGEVLVTTEAASAAGLDPSLDHRRLELKGKSGGTPVVALHVGPPST